MGHIVKNIGFVATHSKNGDELCGIGRSIHGRLTSNIHRYVKKASNRLFSFFACISIIPLPHFGVCFSFTKGFHVKEHR